jgi:predicted ArsR family transcriptional regulator
MAATRTTQQTRHGSQKSKNRPSTSSVQVTVPITTKDNIIDLLREKGALTRGDITRATGIPRTTAYDTLMNLLISGVIEKYVEKNGLRGRPSVYYQLV